MKFYIGSDLHARSVSFAVLDQDGKVVREFSVRTRPEEVLEAIGPYRPEVLVAVEAIGSYYWFVDTLIEAGIIVKLVHPLMVKAISYAKVKTDRVDARTIANLLRMDHLPEAYIYPRERRPIRDLSRRRAALVSERSMHYRTIQTMHQQAALTAPGREKVKRLGAEELKSRFSHSASKLYVGSLVAINTSMSEEVEAMEDYLRVECSKDPRYALMRRIMGIGEVYAQTILLESGDVKRFPSPRQYVSYARLVPGSDNSGGKMKDGHNRNQGNARLKNAYRQAATYAVIHDPTIGRFFERKLRKVHKRCIAYAIVAKKLATGIYFVLKDEVPFDAELLFGQGDRRRRKAVETAETAAVNAVEKTFCGRAKTARPQNLENASRFPLSHRATTTVLNEEVKIKTPFPQRDYDDETSGPGKSDRLTEPASSLLR